MKSRFVIVSLLCLLMFNQLVIGLFSGGTVLCVGCMGSLSLQPSGLTTCNDRQDVNYSDRNIDECTDACVELSANNYTNNCTKHDACRPISCDQVACQGCTDYELSVIPSLFPDMNWFGLTDDKPLVLIGIIAWVDVGEVKSPVIIGINRQTLMRLATVILRC